MVLCGRIGRYDMMQFSEQAAKLVDSVRVPEARLLTIPLLAQQVESTFRTVWPGCRAMVFGSTQTGLALQHYSDVDIVVLQQNHTDSSPFHVDVDEAKSILERFPELFTDFSTVPNAVVPIVIFKHIPTGFQVDVSFKGIQLFKKADLISYLVHLDERAFQLVVILCYWGRLQKLIGVGLPLSSYGMVLLIIFYLQQKQILPSVSFLQKNEKPYFIQNWNLEFQKLAYKPRNDESLYQLLGGFFEYYKTFDFDQNIVSTFVARQIKRELFKNLFSVPDEFDLYKLNVGCNLSEALPLPINRACIQDPFAHSLNLGTLMNTCPVSPFATKIKHAALQFQELHQSVFLEGILSISTEPN